MRGAGMGRLPRTYGAHCELSAMRYCPSDWNFHCSGFFLAETEVHTISYCVNSPKQPFKASLGGARPPTQPYTTGLGGARSPRQVCAASRAPADAAEGWLTPEALRSNVECMVICVTLYAELTYGRGTKTYGYDTAVLHTYEARFMLTLPFHTLCLTPLLQPVFHILVSYVFSTFTSNVFNTIVSCLCFLSLQYSCAIACFLTNINELRR